MERAWERLIQSAKAALRNILDSRTVSNLALVGVAAIMNGRPLEYVPVDPKDPIPLTPNHFLFLEASPNQPSDSFHENEKLSAKGWMTAQVLISHFGTAGFKR